MLEREINQCGQTRECLTHTHTHTDEKNTQRRSVMNHTRLTVVHKERHWCTTSTPTCTYKTHTELPERSPVCVCVCAHVCVCESLRPDLCPLHSRSSLLSHFISAGEQRSVDMSTVDQETPVCVQQPLWSFRQMYGRH